MADESKHLDNPIWEFSIICELPPFLSGYKLILRLLLVHRNPGNLDMISMIFAAVICDADEPCSVKTAWAPESSYTMFTEHECAFVLLKFWF